MFTKKACALLLGTAIAGVLLPFSFFAQESAPQTGIMPEGWYAYPESNFEHLDESTRRCFNFSRNNWQVTNDGNGIEISRLIRQKGGAQSLPSLPPFLKHEAGMPGHTVGFGLQSATHFGNGWLLAFDAGEFGGGLWLTNDDGSETKQILSDNVHAVVPIDGGVLVLSGLAHMGMDFGNARIFSNPNGLSIWLRQAVHLDGEPRAFVKESDGSVLFVTTHGLHRITTSGSLQNLVELPEWTRFQYANSMAIASDGDIFIGMRMFVLRLSAISDGYSQEWLLPTECRHFYLKQSDCDCKP
jgi:hypothetical protein